MTVRKVKLTPSQKAIRNRLLETCGLMYGYSNFLELFSKYISLDDNDLATLGGGFTTLTEEFEDAFIKWAITGDRDDFLDLLFRVQVAVQQELEHADAERQLEEQSKPQTDESGFIYVLKSQDIYKVGKSRDLSKRLRAYTTENPFGTELILSGEVWGYHKVERHLHGLFADKRFNGEWFKLVPDDLVRISTILEDNRC